MMRNNFLTRVIKDLISAYKWVFKGLSKEFPMPFEHYSPPINHYKFSINDHYYDEFTREIWDKIIKEGLSVVNKNEHWIWINK